MKVSDVIKITDDKTEVFIYTQSKYLDCFLEKDSYECDDYDDEFGCGGCEHSFMESSEWESYHGNCSDVPIKLAEKKVISLNARKRSITAHGRGRKKEDFCFLGIQVSE